MKCTVCGSDNLEGSAYCEDCGAKLPVGAAAGGGRPAAAPMMAPPPVMSSSIPQMPVAPVGRPAGPTVTCACGAVNSAGEQYCHDCGANLQGGGGAQGFGGPAPMPVVSSPPPMQAPPPAYRPSTTAKLRATAYGRDFPLDKDVTLMGRRSPADGIDPEVDLTPMDPDSYASRRHARIVRQGDQFFLEDLGSSNGTFLNSVRLEKGVEHPLKDGDKVRFGKTEFVFSA